MKKISLKTAVIAIVFICFGITFSNAQAKNDRQQKEPPTYAKLLKEMDANEDGKLAKAELKGPLKDDFKKIDTNEDGFISEKELEKAPKPKQIKQRKNK